MKVICAWCHCHISGPKDAPPDETSHGICPACLRKHFPAYVTDAMEENDARQSESASS